MPYSPYATGSAATRVFWGDTHLHTAYSMDAGAFGNRLGLDEAYRFARGEEIDSTSFLGKRKSDAAAANFLRMIKADPKFVQRTLAA